VIYLDRRGVTLVELIVVISIIVVLASIGIYTLRGGGLTSEAKAKSNAENLRQFLNFARMTAIGREKPIVVAFNPAQKFYYVCEDSNDDGDCSPSEQVVPIAMPDTGQNATNENVKGVTLKYDTNFGTFTQAGNPERIARYVLSGSDIQRASDGSYYKNADTSTEIASDGMHTTLTSPARFVFHRNGTSDGGSVYLYFKQDDDVSYHYAISVNALGKVDLYQWLKVNNTYRWKLISTR